jgi:hypothetical protein
MKSWHDILTKVRRWGGGFDGVWVVVLVWLAVVEGGGFHTPSNRHTP